MKHSTRFSLLLGIILNMSWLFCGMACDPDLEDPCVFALEAYLPRNVDSIHVAICNKDSVCSFF